ncbi:hypothetical protein GFK27_24555, partial [Salmonella enterica subsp. enterica serovar Enteritidis]|nr:hypothetical protein [Salmonella enterica subsp. enterica serovar Enteritidis]
MRTQHLRPRARTEKEFRDAARKNRRVFVCASTHYSHLCNTDHIKSGWGVGAEELKDFIPYGKGLA